MQLEIGFLFYHMVVLWLYTWGACVSQLCSDQCSVFVGVGMNSYF